jgi:hypothetical protein
MVCEEQSGSTLATHLGKSEERLGFDGNDSNEKDE